MPSSRIHFRPQIALALASIFALILLLASCSGDQVMGAYLRTNQDEVTQPYSVDSRPVRFEVAPGSPAQLIAQQLQEANLIGDARLFEAYVRVNGLATRLEAGTFILSPNMPITEIARILQSAQAASVTVTIPEGWRLGQTADYLDAAQVVDGSRYRALAESGDLGTLDPGRYPFLGSRPLGASLEGYLFPDTYEIPAEGAVAEDLLGRQLDAFAARIWPAFQDAQAAGTTDLDLYAVLTLASIVEREAVVANERPAIAGVYLNRLAIGMKLEADPTVQYGMGYQPASGQWWKTPVFLEEYSSVNSPYNTYLYAGLPPGPIASPGLSSVQAVLAPEEHDYLYFVALPDGSGGHVFATTFDEHLINVQRYQGR